MSKPITFDDYLENELQNPEFKAEWDALEPEFQIIRSSIEGHEMNGLRRYPGDATGGVSTGIGAG